MISKVNLKGMLAATALGLSLAGAAQADVNNIVFVSAASIGVNPFLIMGKEGTEEAAAKIGATASVIESDTQRSRVENVNAAANDGADIVVVLGFEFNDIIADVAPVQPETQFLMVNSCVFEDRPANVHCAVFREYEAAFLMGVAAAMNTKSNKIGTVAALDIPFLHRFSDGFAMGARMINPEIEVETRWIGGQNPFGDPARAKELAKTLNGEGADVIFAVAGGGNFGIYEAASEDGFKAIAVDVNHCPTTPGAILESALKGVDQAIVQSVEKIVAGEESSLISYGIAEMGVGAIALDEAGLAESGCVISEQPETAAKLREVAAKIASGDITIEDPMFAQ